MLIQDGIKLIVESGNIDEKVFINNGVKLGKTIPTNGSLIYCDDAFIPDHSWRNLNSFEKNMIIAGDNKQNYSSSILINKLPNNIIALIEQLQIGDCQDYPSILRAFWNNSEIVKVIQSEIIQILYKYSQDHSKLLFHRIVFNPPQIETLTYFIEDKKLNFVGFHIDRSTVFDFTDVDKSKNRLCINVGLENRIVYYINLSLNQMYSLLKDIKTIDFSKLTVDNIGTFFFQNFPNYPVVKIIQAPYEYYIMPTDNVLHDGSSLGKEKHDICLVYLGYFNTHPFE